SAGAMTYFAIFPAGNPDFSVKAIGRLLQADIQRVLQIGAAIHLRTASAAAAAEDFPKNITEGIGEAGSAHAATHAGVGIDPGMAKAVVRPALLLVRQDLVGLFGLF